ncbi:DUF4124 domain-containing protein [Aeromonas rivipollensis]|uniref:DUF4124 domain-containing protein n=1 Tax=Aeromonas rivipollensis TaxID=948519 RepID=UPI0027D9AE77|nr:DUF4124 domain-containing protein [uncultured Aeromonas sp.]MDU1145367.1 DUF4124 domain-containing protein [Aeromonas hydrophila]
MTRMLLISLGCLVAVTAPVARADVYQCTRNGQITFSDIPCSSEAKPLPLNIYTPSPEEVERATRQTREIEENLASSQKQRQIDALRAEMEAKKQQMNREIAGERNEQTRATTETSDLEGRMRSPGVQAVTRQYQNEMEALNKKINTLQQSK